MNTNSNDNKIVKSVSFSKLDPMDLALHAFAMRNKYFSTYIKRLIQRDMENGQKVTENNEPMIVELLEENKKLKEQLEAIKKIVSE
ncbi:hypothetical protein AB3N02_22070 [Priestia aryabhattai]|uniref:hypothetical protein n=1 Tax=Priestia aryabhattai TaxID=412384 RepID=UPI00399FDAFA